MNDPGVLARLEKREAWAQHKHTDQYIQGIGWYALQRDESIIRELIGSGPGRLLDIPCGSGRFLGLQRQLGFSVVAADYSPTMLDQTARITRGNLLRADIFRPPFERHSFDVILISRLMFHYPDPVEILARVLPLLRCGGRVVFDTLNAGSLRWLASGLLKKRQNDPATRLYFENPKKLARRLTSVGLEIRQSLSCYILPTRAYGYLPRWITWLVHGIERIWPSRMRVITFWQVTTVHPSLVESPESEAQLGCHLCRV